jgi:hypothetical protein
MTELEHDLERMGDWRDRPWGRPLTVAGGGDVTAARAFPVAQVESNGAVEEVHADQMTFVFAEEQHRLRRQANLLRADDLILGHAQADLIAHRLDIERLQRIELQDEARGELELDVARREEEDSAARAQLQLAVAERQERQRGARGELDLTRERFDVVAHGIALLAGGVVAAGSAVSGAVSAGLPPAGVAAAGAGAVGTVATGTLAAHRWRGRQRAATDETDAG